MREWTEEELRRGWRYADADEPRDEAMDAEVAAYHARQRELDRIRAEGARAELLWDRPVQGPARIVQPRICEVCCREYWGRACCL